MELNRAVRICGFILFLALLVWGAVYLWPIIIPLILAVLLAYILQPFVKGFEQLEVKKSAAIMIVFAYFYIILASVVALCLPILNAQFKSLLALLPDLLGQLRTAVERFAVKADSALLRDIVERVSASVNDAISNKIATLFKDTGSMVSAIFRVGFYGVLTPFLAFYVDRKSVV